LGEWWYKYPMAVPDFQTMMRPVLVICKDKAKNTNEVINEYNNGFFDLSEDDMKEPQPNGRDSLIRNRTQWAFKFLFEANLLERTQRGYYLTSELGKKVIEENKERVDNSVLQQFDAFNKWRKKSLPKKIIDEKDIKEESDLRTPDERMRDTHQEIINTLKTELLEKIMNGTPRFFEQTVLKLLIAMNYGGSYKEAIQHIGRTGDEGIDGIINEDRLGLNKIYIQAKRWKEGNNVGSPELDKFAGSLSRKKANKGLFITTSDFTSEAIKAAKDVSQNIVLIDGEKLTDLMIENNVGVKTIDELKIGEIDDDFFQES